MNRILFRLAVCATVLAGLTASAARADLITGSVQFDPALSTPKVVANDGVDPDGPAPGIAFNNWSSSAFTNLLLPKTGTIVGGALTGDVSSFALEKGEPAHFGDSGHGTPISLTFDIHDGGVPGSITFTGLLYGTLSKNAGGTETSSVYIDWTGSTSKSLDVNHHVYTLSISDSILMGTFPDTSDLGEVSVNYKVTHNPEPASLVLAGLALPALGLTWLRKRRSLRTGNAG